MSTPSSGRGGRKQSKMVIMKLSSARLAQFPSSNPTTKAATTKPVGSKTSSSPSTPSAMGKESPSQQLQPQQQQQQQQAAEGTDEIKTETPNDTASNLQVPAENKRRGGPRAGPRRSGAGGEGTPRARGKPGPKRRKLLDPALAMEEAGKPWSTTAPVGSKLGPKANQGAINAGLRALDRSGAPCRRWAKRPFVVKSFTGMVWESPTWSAPKRGEKDDGEEEGENGENGEGDDGPVPPSSNIGSEAPMKEVNGANDSPAPLVEATA